MENYGWIEIVFTATVALGWGFYQLWSVNREIAKDKAKKEREEAALDSASTGSSPASWHSEGEHELDDR